MGSIHEDTLEDGFTMETKLFLILGVVAVTAGVAFGSEDNYILSDEFIAEINQKAKTWTAGRNFDVKTPRSRFMGMMGVLQKTIVLYPLFEKTIIPKSSQKTSLLDLTHESNGQCVTQSAWFGTKVDVDLAGLLEQQLPCLIAFAFIVQIMIRFLYHHKKF